jgi:hypothetical protein
MLIYKKWLIAIAVIGFIGIIFHLSFRPEGIQETQQSDEVRNISIIARLAATPINHSRLANQKSTAESFDETPIFDDSIEGTHLKTHFNLLESNEPGVQELQVESLKKMREKSGDYFAKLEGAYEKLDRLSFIARYKLVFMMEELKSSDAIPFLKLIANHKSTEEATSYEGEGGEHIDEARNESMIRMRAVGGLYAIANEGNDDARSTLLEILSTTKDRAVKNDAIWAYLTTSNDLKIDKEYLKALLPEDEHQFITIQLDPPP